ncbi:hypothetical protein BLOT_011151 [Blomia tropicalis]|nr:hypothetical protein BLOT_011151 [Blomia tropicalis]
MCTTFFIYLSKYTLNIMKIGGNIGFLFVSVAFDSLLSRYEESFDKKSCFTINYKFLITMKYIDLISNLGSLYTRFYF